MHRSPKHKIPIRIAPARRKQVRFRGSGNHVRLTELPPHWKRRLRWKVGSTALDLALVHPRLNRRNFLVRQTKLIREFQLARLWKPRGHDAFARDKRDLPPV